MKKLLWAIVILAIVTQVFTACSDKGDSIGESLLGTTKINVLNKEDKNISIKNTIDATADISKMSIGLLGTLNDEVFGKTQSGFAFQLRLPGYVKFEAPKIDSVKLFLEYANAYGGDTDLLQTVKVYKIEQALNYLTNYDNSFDISPLLGDEVGQTTFNKKLVSDSIFLKSKVDNTKDSILNGKKVLGKLVKHLVVKLDTTKIGRYILNGTENDFKSGSNFLDYFKGLYVKTEDLPASNQGVIYGFNVYSSFMQLYFTETKDTNEKTNKKILTLPITDNSARLNVVKFNHKNIITSDNTNIYLQGIHGTKGIVKVPSVASWKNAKRVSINNAELVFKAKTLANGVDVEKYPLPRRLELIAVDTDDKKEFLGYTNISGQRTANGLLNPTDSTYTFFIPEYIQQIVDGKKTYKHFEISTAEIILRQETQGRTVRMVSYPDDAKNSPARVIIFNSGENKPKLNVVYTKY